MGTLVGFVVQHLQVPAAAVNLWGQVCGRKPIEVRGAEGGVSARLTGTQMSNPSFYCGE